MDAFHVTPVHLVADWDVLRLFQFDSGEVTAEVQQALIAELRPLFEPQGMVLTYQGDLDWRLESTHTVQIKTSPLEQVTGGNLHDYMPRGEDALLWKKLLNESQMVLHSSPINRQRQQQGVLVVNGIWIWREPSLMQRGWGALKQFINRR